jgi:hypothetical protein
MDLKHFVFVFRDSSSYLGLSLLDRSVLKYEAYLKIVSYWVLLELGTTLLQNPYLGGPGFYSGVLSLRQVAYRESQVLTARHVTLGRSAYRR